MPFMSRSLSLHSFLQIERVVCSHISYQGSSAKLSCPQVAIPAAAGLALLSQGSTWPGCVMLLMAAVAGWAFYLWCAACPAQSVLRVALLC